MNLADEQLELEKLYNKNQVIKRVTQEFLDGGFESVLIEKEIPVKFGMDLLVQMALHKRVDLRTIVGILRKHTDSSQLCADLLKECAEKDLVDYNTTLKVFITKFTISQDVQEELDRYQFPLPMIVNPRKVKSNKDTGYFNGNGSIILRNNFHNDDVCLDHINRMNSIKLQVDEDIITFVQNSWRNLDRPKEGETKEKFERRKRAFNKYDRTCKDVIATITEKSKDFHLTHKYCKRGRTYSQG